MIKITDKYKWDRTSTLIGSIIWMILLIVVVRFCIYGYTFLEDADLKIYALFELPIWLVSIGVQIAIASALFNIVDEMREYNRRRWKK